jgi:glutamate N-acetyltransferase / amino-acid N-acetyltransferase
MSVTAASGFAASGVSAGIRRSGLDLAVVRSDAPSVGAALWTTNRVQAAPVIVSKKHLAAAEPQAVVINAGVANAATGEGGIAAAERTAAEAATALGLRSDEVVVLSAGVIGIPLPMDRVLRGVRDACATLDAGGGGGGERAAAAILTTDRSPKQAAVQCDGFTVGGMAKGAGMIHPRLATMLALITTDYPLAAGEPSDFLLPAVEASFNRIAVDGECSTNDAVVLRANGASGAERTDEPISSSPPHWATSELRTPARSSQTEREPRCSWRSVSRGQPRATKRRRLRGESRRPRS